SSPFEPAIQSGDWIMTLVFSLLASAIAPIYEEVFFRGMVYNCLRQKMHPLWAAVIQALAFGLMHTYGIAYVAATWLMGLVLAAIYEWRQSLLAPIFVHGFYNSAAGIVAVLAAVHAANGPELGIIGKHHDLGYLVTEVRPSTAAAEAGLQVNDVITS